MEPIKPMEPNPAAAVDSPCCWLGLCCPPDHAAASLAKHLNIPLEAAHAVLKEFRLVPRGVPQVLHDHLNARLSAYLSEHGHPLE